MGCAHSYSTGVLPAWREPPTSAGAFLSAQEGWGLAGALRPDPRSEGSKVGWGGSGEPQEMPKAVFLKSTYIKAQNPLLTCLFR